MVFQLLCGHTHTRNRCRQKHYRVLPARMGMNYCDVPDSQFCPENCGRHVQLYELTSVSHVPLFWHGLLSHASKPTHRRTYCRSLNTGTIIHGGTKVYTPKQLQSAATYRTAFHGRRKPLLISSARRFLFSVFVLRIFSCLVMCSTLWRPFRTHINPFTADPIKALHFAILF